LDLKVKTRLSAQDFGVAGIPHRVEMSSFQLARGSWEIDMPLPSQGYDVTPTNRIPHTLTEVRSA